MYNPSEINNSLNGTPESIKSSQIQGFFIDNPLTRSNHYEYSSGGNLFSLHYFFYLKKLRQITKIGG